MVLFAAFEADVTTKMTVSLAPEPLRSFKNIHLSDFEVTLQGGTSLYDTMENAEPGTIFNQIFSNIKAPKRADWFHDNCGYTCLENALTVK